MARISWSVGMSGLVLISQKVHNAWSKFPECWGQDVCCGSSDNAGKSCDWWRWEWNISGKGTDFISAMRRQACIGDWQIARRWWICESKEEGELAEDSAGSLAKVNNGEETAKILKRGVQAQRNSWEQDKKNRTFVFPAVLGGHFIGGRLHLKVERETKDSTVSRVEGASFAVLPVTSTTLIWLVEKKNALKLLKSAQFYFQSQKVCSSLHQFVAVQPCRLCLSKKRLLFIATNPWMSLYTQVLPKKGFVSHIQLWWQKEQGEIFASLYKI